jgi:MYXO-CTERM domain-containing protein
MRGDGFYRSDPGGGPWTEVGLELADHGMPHELVASPTFATDGTVYAAVDDWLYRSTDRGDTFEIVGPTVVRYEEDAAPYKTLSGPRLDTITFPDASVDRMAILPPGEEVSLTFAGTGVTWVGTRGGGVADVELDGVVVATVDTAGTPVAQETLFEDLTLANGVHTVTLIHVSGDVVSLDALDVHRPLPSAPPTTTPGETGDTGDTTPPVVDTSDTGPAGTDGTTPPTDLPKDEAGGGCGCTSTDGAAPWLALVGLMALARRRETL